MKLFCGKGSCSVVVRMIIHAINIPGVRFEWVDLKTKLTESGENFLLYNPKGTVPALLLDDGQVLTESAVIQQYLADTHKATDLLPPQEKFERYRVLESLNWVITEIHKSLTPLFNANVPSEVKANAFKPLLETKLGIVDKALEGRHFLVSEQFTLADANLFYALTCMPHVGIDIKRWPNVSHYFETICQLPYVARSLKEEGLEKGENAYISAKANQ